ncbi:molybdopterin oxidoreductase family protein [Halocatena marina]|nr:molybdopterin-dependent oxidoreductase [Halocatena marina]
MQMKDERKTSICPSCAVGCSLRYDTETDQATAPNDAVVNCNGQLCPEGISAFDPLETDDRIDRPLIKRDGEYIPVSWETAYDRIESELTRIQNRDPDALAFLGSPHATNEENYLFQKLARALGTNNIDNRARLCHNSVEAAMNERLGSSAMSNSLEDLREADAFLVIGANPAGRQPIAFDSYIRPAIENGATLIQVDPSENRTTQAADLSLSPRPDTDVFVIALLNLYILNAELCDEQFISERTEGFDQFVAAVDDIDQEACAATAGVNLSEVRKIAHVFGRAERATIITATGIGECEYGGTETTDALIDLLLLTGNFGDPGTGMNLFRGMNNEQGANDMGARPHTLPGYQDVTNPTARARATKQWEIEPPATPGRSELDLVRSFGDSIEGAFVFGENPAMTKMDTQRIAQNLDRVFLVVQDPFLTETAAHADVILPASAWSEKSGTVTNLDRHVQRVRQLTIPPEETKLDLEILCELGARLTDSSFAYDGPEDVFEEMCQVNPLYAGMSYSGIEHGGQRWPFREAADEGTQILHEERFMNGKQRVRFEPISIDPSPP